MKIVARIFGVISILIALLFCSLSFYRAGMDKQEIAEQMVEANKQLDEFRENVKTTAGETKTYLEGQIANAEKIIADQPQASTYLIVQIFLGVLIALTLAFAVMLFGKNPKLTMQLLLAAIVVAGVVYFASPDIERGKFSGGWDSRTLALLSGIPVIVSGLWALLAARKSASSKIVAAN